MKTLPPTARAALALCAALLLPINAAAPQGPPYSPELQQLLQRLADVAESLEHSLPSLTCVETGVSEGLNKGKVKKHVDFTANMRAVRTPAGALSESFTLTQINGKPYSKSSYSFPFFTRGGFDSALAYFLPTHQPCYVFTPVCLLYTSIALQLAEAMKERKISKNKMAALLKTSRTQVDRLLDPSDDITLSSLQRAAAIVGRRVLVELV